MSMFAALTVAGLKRNRKHSAAYAAEMHLPRYLFPICEDVLRI